MKTAEMWIKAQRSERTYKCDSIKYSQVKGFYDCTNKRAWNPISFSDYTDVDGKYGFDAFMNSDWEVESLSIKDLEFGKLYYCDRNRLKYKIEPDGKLYFIENEKICESELTYNEVVVYEFWEAE